MKKIFLILFIGVVSLKSFSQNCEERESQLLGAMGSLSAGFLYNTYGLIGSIADGYGHDAYKAATVTDLLNAQQKLADNVIELLEKMIKENVFKDQDDKDYMASSINIIKVLKSQVQIFLNFMNNKKQENLDAYDAQRNKNWKDLSKLMGIKE